MCLQSASLVVPASVFGGGSCYVDWQTDPSLSSCFDYLQWWANLELYTEIHSSYLSCFGSGVLSQPRRELGHGCHVVPFAKVCSLSVECHVWSDCFWCILMLLSSCRFQDSFCLVTNKTLNGKLSGARSHEHLGKISIKVHAKSAPHLCIIS